MRLALFDLDETLIDGDSDVEWARWLSDLGVVDRAWYEQENERFYALYKAGTLDIQEYLAFQLQPLARHPPATLHAWRERFVAERIRPRVKRRARVLLERHRAEGHERVIVTATNRFVTAPIAALLGVEHLVATELEEVAGRYTGRPRGVPCFREGKLENLERWLEERGQGWAQVTESWFYSDSRNDIPLLSRVTHPVAVDPDAALEEHARERGWPVLRLAGV
jgi:HAD superfamily hydrolase (TIGR01490 family)